MNPYLSLLLLGIGIFVLGIAILWLYAQCEARKEYNA
jgi:hypothetical protein